jgi:hypothetical protein
MPSFLLVQRGQRIGPPSQIKFTWIGRQNGSVRCLISGVAGIGRVRTRSTQSSPSSRLLAWAFLGLRHTDLSQGGKEACTNNFPPLRGVSEKSIGVWFKIM